MKISYTLFISINLYHKKRLLDRGTVYPSKVKYAKNIQVCSSIPLLMKHLIRYTQCLAKIEHNKQNKQTKQKQTNTKQKQIFTKENSLQLKVKDHSFSADFILQNLSYCNKTNSHFITTDFKSLQFWLCAYIAEKDLLLHYRFQITWILLWAKVNHCNLQHEFCFEPK